jgi:hypothetical protein
VNFTFIAEYAPLRQLAAKNTSHQRDRHDLQDVPQTPAQSCLLEAGEYGGRSSFVKQSATNCAIEATS